MCFCQSDPHRIFSSKYDPDEFDFSYEFFNSCDTKFVPADSISLVYFFSSSEVDLTDCEPSFLGTIESSLLDYTFFRR